MPIQFSEIQAAIKSEVLPALNNGLTYVGYILSDTGFVFWVTPQMMQDTAFDSTEIDHTDMLALATGMQAIKAVLHVAVAYNVDLPDLRAAGLMEVLAQDGSWMSLHTDGAAHMAQAKSSIITAINLARETVEAVYNEPLSDPNQDDDLLTVSWDSLTYQEYVAVLDDATEAMTQPTWFDLDPADEESRGAATGVASRTMDSVRVDLRQLFDNPLQVPASFAPPYEYALDSVRTVSDSFYVLTITWEADSVPDWHFPDPTFHGLLPDITNDSLLADLVEWNESSWDKVEVDTIPMAPLGLLSHVIGWLPDFNLDR